MLCLIGVCVRDGFLTNRDCTGIYTLAHLYIITHTAAVILEHAGKRKGEINKKEGAFHPAFCNDFKLTVM